MLARSRTVSRLSAVVLNARVDALRQRGDAGELFEEAVRESRRPVLIREGG